MRSWILIASYQLRDIWQRWLETPAAVLARLVVAISLSIALLLLHAAFTLMALSLEERIERLGVNTIIVRATYGSDDAESARAPLGDLLLPLRHEGQYLFFRAPFARAQLDVGGEAQVLVYEDRYRPSVNEFVGANMTAGTLLAHPELPPGIRLSVDLEEGLQFEAWTVRLPSTLERLTSRDALLLVPGDQQHPLLQRGFREIIYFAADDPDLIPELESLLGPLLRAERFDNFNVQSAGEWLDELRELREQQATGSRFAALFCGGLLVLVFSSISLLEYRQNAFIAALIRSFGIPAWLLSARYFLEATLLCAMAGTAAHLIVRALHVELFSLFGANRRWLNLDEINPYALSDTPELTLALAAGATLSILPIVIASRRQVGRILG
ncbi:MAG: hypothetical protein ACFB21_16210 [Opitutales bacterium]